LKRLHEERMPVRIEKVKDGQGWGTFVQVEDEPIRIRLREATIRVEQEPSPSEQRRRRQDPNAYWVREYQSKPTGVLIFALLEGNREDKKWSDGIGKRLEGRIEQIIDGLRRRVEREKRYRLEREAWHQMYATEEKERRRAERERQELAKRIEDLEHDVEMWHKSERIRAYLRAFESRVEKWAGSIDPASEISTWLKWANRYADLLDPLGPGSK
jgi:hypothetical protein